MILLSSCKVVQEVSGLVKVSTGVLQLEKLSVGGTIRTKININAEDNLAYAA